MDWERVRSQDWEGQIIRFAELLSVVAYANGELALGNAYARAILTSARDNLQRSLQTAQAPLVGMIGEAIQVADAALHGDYAGVANLVVK